MTTLTATTASSLVNSLGVNTHLDFNAYGYENLGNVEAAINYLGLKNIRDSASNGSAASTWQHVAQATGAKFDAYIGETSPAGMQTELGLIPQLAQEGILNFIEGGNEEDDAYSASLGNNLQITAQFQQQLHALGQQLGVPVINMSFGSGWTAENNWQGNYDKVGDLSAVADYANAHTYPNTDQTPDSTIRRLNGTAHLAAASRPVIITEMGWDGNNFSQGDVARYVVQAAFDGIKNGDAKTYFYALFNDGSGRFGLMNADGSATPAGASLHNLTSLLADTGSNASNFTPGLLGFSLSGADAGDNTVLMQKSDGSDWLALWNESAGAHTVTLNLDATASQILVFDPVTVTSSIASTNNSSSITLNVGNDPLLIEVIPSGLAPTSPPTSSSNPGTGSTTTSNPETSPTTTPPTVATGPGMSLSAPASIQAATDQAVSITGLRIIDDYATTHPATVTATITDRSGTLLAVDAWGNAQQGAGATGLTLSGTIWQVNAALANLRYTGSSSDSISVHISDSTGSETTQTIAVGGNPTSQPTTSTASTIPAPTSTQSYQEITAGDAQPVITASNISVNASAGDHMIFLSGTGDKLTATGGNETVQSYNGGNSITTSAGNDLIRIAGSGNTIDAGAGSNVIEDSGSNNTIALSSANQGHTDIYGWVTQNGDTFDLRALLAQTNWNGDTGSIGDFVKVNMAGDSAVIAVDPTGVAGGASYDVASLHASGAMSLSSLLAHSIT